MRFTFEGPFKENLYVLMRRLGYHFQREDKERKEFIFTRPARGFPRFHLFVKIKNNNLIFNLHLDQKRTIYKGTTAHSGEYEGEIIEEEAKRIREVLQNERKIL